MLLFMHIEVRSTVVFCKIEQTKRVDALKDMMCIGVFLIITIFVNTNWLV